MRCDSSKFDDYLHLNDQMPDYTHLMNRLRKTLYYGGMRMPGKAKMISRPLTEYTADIFTATQDCYSLKRLSHDSVGQIKASPCSLILALIYLDLLKELDPAYVRRVSPSELFLVAIMVSTKFYSGYDEDFYIKEWAEYGDMTVDRLKALEIEFLGAMDWKIYVSNETFFKKLGEIEMILARKESSGRGGWLTYTELCTLMPSIDIIREAITASALLAISYMAGVICVAGAFFIASNVPGSYLHKGPATSTPDCGDAALSPGSTTKATTDGSSLMLEGDALTGCSNTTSELTLLEEMEQMLANMDWISLDMEESENVREHEPIGGSTRTGYEVQHRGIQLYPIRTEQDTRGVPDIEASRFGTIKKRQNRTSGVKALQLQSFPEVDHPNHLKFLSFLWFK